MKVNRPKLVNSVIDGLTTGAKMYEIIAAFSLCLDDLTEEERKIVNERYPVVFTIEKTDEEVYVQLSSSKLSCKKKLFRCIEEVNEKRKTEGKALIEYDSSRIRGN